MSLVVGGNWFSETGASGVVWHDFIGLDRYIFATVGEYAGSYNADICRKGSCRHTAKFPTLEEAKRWVETMIITGAV